MKSTAMEASVTDYLSLNPFRQQSAASSSIRGSFRLRGDLLVSQEDLLKRPICVRVDEVDGNFVASFRDANVGASGDTEYEAIENLMAMIEDLFEFLADNEEDLGPEPQRQFEILKKYVVRRSNADQGTR